MCGLCWGGGGGQSSPLSLVTSLLKGRPNGTAPHSALQAPHWTVGNNAALLKLF